MPFDASIVINNYGTIEGAGVVAVVVRWSRAAR